MKTTRIFPVLLLAFLSVSCTKTSIEMMIPGQETEKMELKGTFVSQAHPTSGTVSVNKERTVMTFTNFKTDTGPLVEVWLSTTTTPSNPSTYTSLGMIKGVDGDYTYSIPASVDFSSQKIVNIWCVDFSVSFGYAELK